VVTIALASLAATQRFKTNWLVVAMKGTLKKLFKFLLDQ
jgi:hypothetical protein